MLFGKVWNSEAGELGEKRAWSDEGDRKRDGEMGK